MKRKILSIILCAALLSGFLSLPANAKAAAPACKCGKVVEVFISGFGSSLYYDQGTPEERKAEFTSTENLAADIFKLLGGMMLSMITFNTDHLADGVSNLIWGMLGHVRLDERGKSVEPIGSHWNIDYEKDHTESPSYGFSYDFRIDPFEAAAQLNEFIEALCKHTGHKTVAVTAFSEGADVAMTYLSVYGHKRLNTLMLTNGAWQGLTLVGELFSNKLALSGKSLTNYLGGMSDDSGLLKPFMMFLQRAHVLDFTEPLGKWIVRTMGDRIFEKSLLPLFGQWPAMWAFVPAEYFDSASEMLRHDAKYEYMLGQVEKYSFKVQRKAEQLLKAAAKDGVKIAVIAGYGFAPIIGTEAQDYQTDSMIDTARMSGGATVAKYGETLPPSDSKYRSPDGIIDASTCMFPDYTWFYVGRGHDSGASDALRKWIVYSKKQPTVRDNPAFPQFM